MSGVAERRGLVSVGAAAGADCGRCAAGAERFGCERRDPHLTSSVVYLTGIAPADARARFGGPDAGSLCGGVQSMLFAHCGVLDRQTLVRRAEQVLDHEKCRLDAGCLWLALLVLVYADRGAQATAYCEHLLGTAGGALPRPAAEVLILVKARVDTLAGRPADAVRALAPLQPRISPALRGMALAWLLEALVRLGDLRTARRLACEQLGSPDTLPDRAHVLTARGELHHAVGEAELGLADHVAAGKALTSVYVANPAIVPWRSRAAGIAAELGRGDLATALAEDELAAARRWGSPGAVGRALRALGTARRDAGAISTLERAIELLDLADLRYELMAALCDLGALHAETGDAERARGAIDTATALAAAAGSRTIEERAKQVLETLGHRDRAARLTRQEMKIAELALRGSSNKAIAETLFLTVRTVEFHLSNVYRKLGIAGRRQLPQVMGRRESA